MNILGNQEIADNITYEEALERLATIIRILQFALEKMEEKARLTVDKIERLKAQEKVRMHREELRMLVSFYKAAKRGLLDRRGREWLRSYIKKHRLDKPDWRERLRERYIIPYKMPEELLYPIPYY